MPDSSTRSPVPLTLTGIENDASLPAILTSTARSAGGADDIFLPPGYLVPTRTFDVGPAARSAAIGAATQEHQAAADEVVVLELADGSTLVTSAARLRTALQLAHPELVDGDTVLLEQLRAASALPSRGLGSLIGGVISKVYTLAAGRTRDAILDAALGQLDDQAELGVSWRGTRALMRAIEERLDQQPGLYRWSGAADKGALLALPPGGLAEDADPKTAPMLVFVHGTGSSTLGSFGDLRTDQRGLWSILQRRYGERIFGFEHRTLSESPIDNAIALVRALPRGAHVSLVSHSRGGLVCDLLCLGDFDELIDDYCYPFPGTGAPDPAESRRVHGELDEAHAAQREQLRELAHLLRERRVVVQRYVRCASPANGTLLASGNFDVFLSGLLTLIGAVPFFFGSPLYSAFKRVVIEIAKNRTDPHLVPGIEAMLPDSPMARLLHESPVQPGLAMALIAGDTEGGNMLGRLGVLLTDFLLFDQEDHDLVVNTTSMLAGIAARSSARVLFDRGAHVSHFRYFSNFETRAALRDWLIADDPARLPAFRPLPAPQEYAAALAAATRGADIVAAPNRPVVVILPGVMGSSLLVGGADKVWFDAPDLILGGLSKIAWAQHEVDAGELSPALYGQLGEHLALSHRVELFPYDWRQPLDVLGTRLADFLERLLKQTGAPIRLLAHSMGGLVVRACIHQRRALMDTLMARPGARLIMLGTPNHGAHSMVENVLGKGDALRKLARLDLKHDMQEVLDIIAGFRGALQLLPRSGFSDTFQGQDGGGQVLDYQRAQTWVQLKGKVTDFWFGDHRAGTPSQATLDAAAWLWRADGSNTTLPPAYENNSVYVFGQAPNTPCGVREDSDGRGGARLKMVGTSLGDGTVTWDSGRLGGIGSYYYAPVKHGDLPCTAAYFPALAELLNSGATGLLGKTPPATRAAAPAAPVSYDAGPPSADDADTLQRALLGGSPGTRMPPGSRRRLAVAVQAMDLRFLAKPILVGHYEQDPIAGAEALIDSELLAGDLSMRYNLGPYAGPRGTATVVLRHNGERLSGAVVTGLGRYEGALSPSDLTECVCTGALRYLLQVVDVLGKADREVRLASLLIGYNSSANLSVAASVEALVRGVMEANARFYESTRLNIRIARLDLVELYMDTAITAVYALRELSTRLAGQAGRHGAALVINSELVQGEGIRQRLFDTHQSSYWPRLLVTGAERTDAAGAPVAAVADRLRYLFVSQRARAETVVQQRQPGLAESLVQQQIHDAVWNPDFGRMLFQLMIPHDFKGPARQLDRLVLVVDALTANLPWELMLASEPNRRPDGSEDDDNDARPLALRAAVVRQLSSSSYRAQVRPSIARHALVVGNPSVKGFAAAFPHMEAPAGQHAVRRTADPIALPGAEKEARVVETLLSAAGYAVEPVIGEHETAQRVLSALYRQPWRILHISAHGIFDIRHADGRKRSGVVLSDGLLITAAEIAAMEIVPELVFLNCCHLGQVDTGRSGNKLAASVARELIDIGVRCVIVSGWAVRDASAMCFGQAFYEQLLVRRLPFGEAVFEARKATWEAWPTDITWGAFQAYGDPGWMAEPRAEDAAGARTPGQFASLEELLDELARTRVSLSHLRGAIEESEARRIADNVTALIEQRTPPGWQSLPQLHSALGATWFELNRLETARAEFIAAIGATDQIGVVPIHDIERLANVEVLLGEGRSDGGTVAPADGEALIDLALKRLDGLEAVLAAEPGAAPSGAAVGGASTVRSALRASAWKGKASLQARRLQAGKLDGEAGDARARLHQLLGNAIDVYRRAEGFPGASDFVPTLALKRLALEALNGGREPAQRDAALALARHCRQHSERDFSHRIGMWEAVTRPEAMLVEQLILGSLGQPGDAAQATVDAIGRAYADATSNIALKRSEIDAIASDIDLLARFYDVSASDAEEDQPLALTAARLAQLGRRLQAGGAAGAL